MRMRLQGTVLLIILASLSCRGQGKLINSVPLNGKVHFASVDRPGDLYVVMEDGLVKKFDLNGKEIATGKFDTAPTLFDAGDGTRSFAYFREKQLIEFLSPDISRLEVRPVNPEFAISPWLICPSKNELWILDSADLSLKQTLDRGAVVGFDASWTGTRPASLTDTQYMREYLNFLFVLDKTSGLYIFNHLGKPIRKINETNLEWFNFLGEELYYRKDQSLHFMDIYTGEQREIVLPVECRFAILTDERMILINEDKIEFREFKL